jgi:hypothetical protein
LGNIPLPALAINPPVQQEDPVTRLMRMRAGFQQIQSGQLELQQRQQALQDQKAMTQAMLSWDGKDPSELAHSVIKNGGSANAATTVQQHYLGIKDTASQIALRDAQSGEANLKTVIEKHNQFLGAISAAEQVPDEELHDHVATAIHALIPDNADPQALQFKQQTMQLLQSGIAPADLRQQIDVQKKSLLGSKEQFQQAQTEAETRKTSTEALLSQSKLDIQKAWKSDPESVLAQVDKIVPPTGPNATLNMRTKSQLMFALRRGDIDGAKDALKQAAEHIGAVEKTGAEAMARVVAETSPTAIAGEAKKKSAISQATGGLQQVYATTPQGQTLLMPKEDAQNRGYGYQPVGAKQVQEGRQLNNRLADVTQKIAQYEQSFQTPLASNGWFSQSDKHLIAQVLGDDKFKLGISHTELPVDWMNKLGRSSLYANMSKSAQARVIAYFNAREAIQGYQRVLTGSGRSSEKAMDLNLDTLPAPIDPESYAGNALKAFKQNLSVAGQGMPILPGVKTPEEIEQQVNTR